MTHSGIIGKVPEKNNSGKTVILRRRLTHYCNIFICSSHVVISEHLHRCRYAMTGHPALTRLRAIFLQNTDAVFLH